MYRFDSPRYAYSGGNRLVVLVALAVLSVCVGASPGLAGDWQGQVVEQDGVQHVSNPAHGMEDPITVQLREAWRIGGDTDVEEEFFGVINRVTTDEDGNIYLLDSQLSEVKVFSPAGEYLRTLGREGEGPGEFRLPQDMFFLPNGNLGVLTLAPGRIVMLTKDGEPVGDHPLPAQEGGAPMVLLGGQLMGDKLLLVGNENKFEEGKLDIVRYIDLIDSEGKVVKRILESPRTLEFASAVIDEKDWSTFDRRWQVGPDDRLYACPNFADYEIVVWNKEGNKKRVITREFERWSRPQEDKDRIKGIFEAFTRQVPNAKVVVSDFDQDVANIYPRADGTLWVLSSRGSRDNPEGSLGVFDIFDEEGRFVRQVTLMGEGDPYQDGYFFVKDRLYVVTGFLDAAMAAQGGGTEETEPEEDLEPMAVICYELDTLEAGME